MRKMFSWRGWFLAFVTGVFLRVVPGQAQTCLVVPASGPFSGGDRLVITNCVPNVGNGSDITNVTVGGVSASLLGQGLNWVAVTVPVSASAGAKDVVVRSTSVGPTTYTACYTVNPAGRIGESTEDWSRWQAVAALPTNMSGRVAGVLNGALYAVGGRDVFPGNARTNVYKYDGISWMQAAGLPGARYDSGVAALGGSLYSCGGYGTADSAQTNVYRYNGTNWSAAAGLPEALGGQSVVALNGALYVIGGSIMPGWGETNVYRFDGTNWTVVAGMPAEREDVAAAALNNSIYAVGGSSSYVARTNVYRFNGTNWSEVTALPAARYGMGAGVLNGWLYAIGGTDGSTARTNVYKFDGTNWLETAALPSAAASVSASVLNGALYAVLDGTNVYRYPRAVAQSDVIVPANGSTTGGCQVVIYGADLGSGSDITNVTLCGISVAGILSQSATQVTVRTAAGPAGLGDVAVYSTSYGVTVKSNGFTYAATVPSSGPLAGGNSITITAGILGNGADITNVTVGGVSAVVTAQDTDYVTILAPATGAAGAKDIVIKSTSTGVSTFAGQYRVNPAGLIRGPAQVNWSQWGAAASMPAVRSGAGAGVLNGALYAVGGMDAGAAAKTNVYRFDETGWIEVAGLPSARKQPAVAVLNGYLYAAGGQDAVNNVKTNVYRFDGAAWTEVAGLPSARFGMSAAVLNGAAYFLGGSDASMVVKTNMFRFDGTNWSEVTALPAARYGAGIGVLDGRLYAAGGFDGSQVATNVYCYNGTNWAEVTGLPSARYVMADGVLSGSVYAVAGRDASGNATTNSYRYNGTNWLSAPGLPVARAFLASGVLNGGLYAFGGTDGTNTFADVYRYPAASYDSGVSPSVGSYAGGYQVTVSGLNLGSGSDVTNVTICGIRAAGIVSQSSTQIVVTAGTGTRGQGDVVVYSTSYGITSKTNAFTYTSAGISVLGTNGAGITSGSVASAQKGTDFGALPAGASRTNTLSITNVGNAVLNIGSWSTNGAGRSAYAITGLPQVIGVSSSVQFQVVFSPQVSGVFYASLDIVSDDPSAPSYSVNLCGSTWNISTRSGPFPGGNSITITNGVFGNGSDITNVTVGGVSATIQGQGSTWVTILIPAAGTAGLKDIVIRSTSVGATTIAGAYTVNPAGRIYRTYEDWNNWQEVAGLPAARWGQAVKVLNGALYAIGGDDGAGPCDNVYRFNGTNWTEVNALPSARSWISAAVLSGSIHVMGGGTNVYRFDGTNWAEEAGLPAYRQGLAAGTLNGSIYATAGSDGAELQLNTFKFDGTNWTEVTAVPRAVDYGSAELYNGTLHVFGGYDQTLYRFDGSVWAEAAPIPAIKLGQGAAVFNGGLYAIGGLGYLSLLPTAGVYRYDGISWSESAPLPASRSGLGAAVLGGVLYAVGGADEYAATTNVYRYPALVTDSGVNPGSGSYAGGYQLVISGSDLGDGSDITNVTVCGVPVAGIVSQCATQVIVTAAGSVPGTGHVVVYSTSFGVTVRSNSFTYNPTVTVSAGAHGSVSPSGVVEIPYGVSTGIVVSADAYYSIAALQTNGVSVPAAAGRVVYTSLWTSVTQTGALVAAFAEDVTTNSSTPLWWLAANGLTGGSWEDQALSDTDADGMAAWQEYIAGTQPTNGQSVLQITNIVFSSSNVCVTWDGGEGVWQYLDRATNITGTGTVWTAVWSNPPPNAATTNFTVPTLTNTMQFFRIRAGR